MVFFPPNEVPSEGRKRDEQTCAIRTKIKKCKRGGGGGAGGSVSP